MLGELLMRQGLLIRVPKVQQTNQGSGGAASRDFITRYLGCFGLSPTELDKLPRVLREGNISADAARCIAEAMGSTTWEEAFTKINLEAALLEVASRRELQQLTSNNQATGLLSLYSLYSFVSSISAIRTLINNDATRPIGLATLTKATYLLFDLYLELTKRKVIPPSLEAEVWRVRDTLGDMLRELFKGNRTMTVHDKPFDRNK
jgi:hypothetical protein